ncbi:MAG: DUF4012 domain-containing protein [bacterium]|nr:MAG: DUF4012 domain-containing protein [bacterium]
MEQESAILIPKIEPDKKVEVVVPQEHPGKKIRIRKKTAIILSIVLFIILIFTIPSILFFSKAQKTYKELSPIIASAEFSDLDKVKSDFSTAKNSIFELRQSYVLVSWMKYLPFAGSYVSDLGAVLNASVKGFEAGEIAFVTLDPLLLELGYKKDGVDSSEKSAQERIDFVVNSIPEIVPKADEISLKLIEAEVELSKIDPNRYPEEIRGIKLRNQIKTFLDIFKSISKYVSESKPLLESAPYLLGVDNEDGTPNERNYLVLFQNDKELRPTGGFLTAYSVMKVSNAKFEPVTSDDIYNLDAKYKPAYPAPDAIVDLIKGPYILSKNVRLRDMNYNPDFKLSMDFFSEEASKVGMDGIDGIIAVDTFLLVNILDALGEIGVPGFGNYSSKNDPRCNCPQVVYELESFADIEGPIIWDPLTGKIILRPPNSDNRKKIIGPLMNSILANAMAQPKDKIPDLLNAVFNSVIEKHVLFYMFDKDAQNAVEGFGIAGRIEDYPNGDYLHISDSNLGGRKSNLYVRHEVEQDIEINKDGMVEKTVVLTYKNPEKHDGWLNSVLPNWVRIYVPQGSKLISVEGLLKEYETVDELGKTVFSGHFSLRPEGVSKVVFKYTLPFKVTGDYNLLIQKQPGTDAPLYVIRSGKYEEEFLLKTDKELKIGL